MDKNAIKKKKEGAEKRELTIKTQNEREADQTRGFQRRTEKKELERQTRLETRTSNSILRVREEANAQAISKARNRMGCRELQAEKKKKGKY